MDSELLEELTSLANDATEAIDNLRRFAEDAETNAREAEDNASSASSAAGEARDAIEALVNRLESVAKKVEGGEVLVTPDLVAVLWTKAREASTLTDAAIAALTEWERLRKEGQI